MAGEAVGQWYEVNIAQSPLVKGSVGLQFLAGAGAAVGEMIAGGLQVNVKEIGQGVAVLATDADARARLVDGLVDTWNRVLSGDAYVTGYAPATVASVLRKGTEVLDESRLCVRPQHHDSEEILMEDRLSLEALVALIRESIGARGRVEAVDSAANEVVFTMYDALGFKCGLDNRYRSFGLVLPVEAGAAIRTFLGRDVSADPDPESIRESLALVDQYCRLRLPDKYLEHYGRVHPTPD